MVPHTFIELLSDIIVNCAIDKGYINVEGSMLRIDPKLFDVIITDALIPRDIINMTATDEPSILLSAFIHRIVQLIPCYAEISWDTNKCGVRTFTQQAIRVFKYMWRYLLTKQEDIKNTNYYISTLDLYGLLNTYPGDTESFKTTISNAGINDLYQQAVIPQVTLQVAPQVASQVVSQVTPQVTSQVALQHISLPKLPIFFLCFIYVYLVRTKTSIIMSAAILIILNIYYA